MDQSVGSAHDLAARTAGGQSPARRHWSIRPPCVKKPSPSSTAVSVMLHRWKSSLAVIEHVGLTGAQARARPMRWRFLSTDPGSTVKCTCPSSSTATTRTTAWTWRLPATSIVPARKRSLVQIQHGPRHFSKLCLAVRAAMRASHLQFCPFVGGHSALVCGPTRGSPVRHPYRRISRPAVAVTRMRFLSRRANVCVHLIAPNASDGLADLSDRAAAYRPARSCRSHSICRPSGEAILTGWTS
jgi:hypothetical protein